MEAADDADRPRLRAELEDVRAAVRSEKLGQVAAEFYAVVEGLPEIADSVVIHLEESDQLLLFVALRDGFTLDEALEARLRAELRSSLSPRHVPDRIMAVPAVPRTLSGKKLEVPVKRILTGTPVDVAASRGALANPDSLDAFAELAASLSHPE
jgi:acetoacetyl-CoA synthetase